jgi:hypothetical protein
MDQAHHTSELRRGPTGARGRHLAIIATTIDYSLQQATSFCASLHHQWLGTRRNQLQSKTSRLARNDIDAFLCGILANSTPPIVELESISVKGNFLLQEFDKKEVSILDRKGPDNVVDGLVGLLQELPKLKCLDLENCHIPYGYLADLWHIGSHSDITNNFETTGQPMFRGILARFV